MKKIHVLVGRDWSVRTLDVEPPVQDQDIVETVYPDTWGAVEIAASLGMQKGELGRLLADLTFALRKYRLVAETPHAKYYEEVGL